MSENRRRFFPYLFPSFTAEMGARLRRVREIHCPRHWNYKKTKGDPATLPCTCKDDLWARKFGVSRSTLTRLENGTTTNSRIPFSVFEKVLTGVQMGYVFLGQHKDAFEMYRDLLYPASKANLSERSKKDDRVHKSTKPVAK